ncbi:MAG TPA: protein phosphatase 2C domain-containing protein [Longimicrobiales bacterium]|nr:protein phosphatase 2C domain-containing protein [Longimicrobiales bacterium]
MPDDPVARPERPRFSDIDLWGLTHPGKVRATNQDHFFAGALARGLTVDHTSLAGEGHLLHAERLASLAVVADGVGGSGGGEEAARIAVRDLISSVSRFFHDAARVEPEDPEVFSRLLQDAALACHDSLLQKAEQEGGARRFSTTLTLFLGLWPHAYLLQVGDSRCYVFRDGELTQITRDQTWAQDLVDGGALTQTTASTSRWANVLSSAIGGGEAAPVVTRVVRDWGTVVLLCSDGLIKHVSDGRIKECLASMTSARQAAERLLQDALEDGGTDNITIIVGRTVK